MNMNKTMKIIIVCLCAVLLALLVLMMVLAGGRNHNAPAEPTVPTTEPSEATVPTTEPAPPETEPEEETAEPTENIIPETPPIKIETPYLTFYYPGEWEELLYVEQVEGDVHTVKFFCAFTPDSPIELFTIFFGTEDGFGYVKTHDSKAVSIAVKSAEIQPDENWSDDQIQAVYAMQEALNDVLSRLTFTEAESTTEPTVIPENNTPSNLDTPYGSLVYPAKWDAYLITEVDREDGYSIKFSAKIGNHAQEHLFTVYFGGDKGIEAATVKDGNGNEVTLRLDVAEPELDSSWSDSERLILLAMQEDMNYLLSNLPM